jgi:F0F1-type ATP synthase membrane subunit b/b'
VLSEPEIYIVISFICFVVILVYKFGRGILGWLDGQIKSIHHKLGEAKQELDSAKSQMHTATSRFAELDSQIQVIINEGHERAEVVKKIMRDQTTALIQQKQELAQDALKRLQARSNADVLDYIVSKVQEEITAKLNKNENAKLCADFTQSAIARIRDVRI